VNEVQIARFWSRVEKSDGCWLWQGCTNDYGYGQAHWGTRSHGAHRVSWELANGPVPAGRCVMHSCDNRLCVNPAHLSVGTNGDNNRDRHAKRRDATGARNPNTRLSPDDVRAIRLALAAGATKRGLARVYGVSDTAIRNVCRGKNHKHVADRLDA
jgi:hypothetical protein